MFTVFIIGPAGSGKSTLTSSLSDFLVDNEIDVIRVNLDPAVEELPYTPEVDVRNYITVKEVMEKYKLGPNGAIIAATDMLIKYLVDIKKEILEYKPGYVLIDTPGQMELFAFRVAGKEIIEYLRADRAVILFVTDTILASKPSTFVSSMLLSLSTHYRFSLPYIILLNKIDLVDDETIEKVITWIENPESLLNDLYLERSSEAQLHEEIVKGIAEFIREFKVIPVSAKHMTGLKQVYTALQQIYVGGEDYLTLAP